MGGGNCGGGWVAASVGGGVVVVERLKVEVKSLGGEIQVNKFL